MKKMIQIISIVLFGIGFFIVAGTAGASDLNRIDLGTIDRNCLIGMTLIIGGVFLARIGGAADGE